MTTFTKLGNTDKSISIRVTEEDGTHKDYGIFDITKRVVNNQESVDADPENVEPTYDEVEENNFTDYFSDIDTDEKFESACISYLNAEQGYKL